MRLLFILLLATAILPAQKRPVTHEDIFLMKRTGDAAPSPDGKWVAFSVTEPDYDATKAVSDLWIVPVDGAAPARRESPPQATLLQADACGSSIAARFFVPGSNTRVHRPPASA